MNKTYRNVWNAATNTWTAAAETAKGRTKGSARAARSVLVALALVGAGMGGAFAAEECTTDDGKKGSRDASGVCQVSASGSVGTTGAIGTMATGTELADNIKFGSGTGAATVAGPGSVAVGANTTATGNYAVAIGGATGGDANGGRGAKAVGNNTVALGVMSEARANNAVALGANTLADRDNTVSVGAVNNRDGSSFTRQIVNVAAGTQDNDAVNLGQMKGALSTKVDDTYFKINGTGTAASATDVGGTAIGIQALATGTNATALGTNAAATRSSVAVGYGASTGGTATNANAGSFNLAMGAGATVAQRDVAGTITDSSNSSAIGYGATVMGTGSNALGNSATVNANSGTALGHVSSVQANNGTALGALAQVASGATGAVALGQGSVADVANTVSVGNSTTKRKIVNMAAGTADTDAVNVSQLKAGVEALGGGATVNADGTIKAPSYTLANGGTQTTVGGALGALDGELTKTNGRVTDVETKLGSGTIGLVQQAAAGQKLTVGKDTDGTEVDFTGTAGVRKLTGIADGTLSDTSTDAVTGKQLNATNTNVTNLSTRVDGINTRVTANETAITDIRNEMGSGSLGLVQQNATTKAITVASTSGGTSVDFKGTDGERKLTGVADADLSDTSTDAVTGKQLNATNTAVAKNTSDITTLNTNVTNLDGRVTTAEGNITNISDKVSKLESGGVGLVQQATPTGDITVAAGTGGSVVNFAGSAGDRRLTGVANAVNDSDAVTMAQLKATGLIDYTGKELGALVYDDLTLGTATLGGVGGTFLNNVRGGLIASGSMQAVNGGQLFDMQAKYDGLISDLDGRVGKIESGIEDGSIGGPGTGTPEGSVPSPGKGDGSTAVGKDSDASGKDSSAIGSGAVASGDKGSAVGAGAVASGSGSSAIGAGSVASGTGSTAVGEGAKATGDHSTALGQGAQASHTNSVALGAGSTTSRDNEVSIGAPGQERYLGNVKDGVLDTDAVNVRQMNNAVHSARQDAMGGAAAAMAVAGLPVSSAPGKTFMAISGSTYGGEQGTAIGASYMSKDGKWIVKGAVNTSTRGEVGAVVGGGFYW